MDNLINIYTRLKLKVGNLINIIYYTKDGIKHTEEFYLVDIAYFSHIWVARIGYNTIDIPFISEECIIESITFTEDNHPTYLNPYLKQLNCFNPFDDYNELEILMTPIIKYNQEEFKKRKKFIDL